LPSTAAGSIRESARRGAPRGLVSERIFSSPKPQVMFGTKLTDHLGLSVAAGDRFTGLVDRVDDRLNGATGTVSLQIRMP
jgi:hypothetical protein